MKYSSEWIKVSQPFGPNTPVLHVELARYIRSSESKNDAIDFFLFERGPVNALSTEFLQAYEKLFDSLTDDGYDVRAVVLSSAFPKTFTAGLDCE